MVPINAAAVLMEGMDDCPLTTGDGLLAIQDQGIESGFDPSHISTDPFWL
jgi:hypothetical protein